MLTSSLPQKTEHEDRTKNQCPLNNFEPCKQLDCAWFLKIRGTNPNTGEDTDEWGCSVAWMPILLIENAQMSRHTGAAVESFRNEMVKANESSQQLLANTVRKQLRVNMRVTIIPADGYVSIDGEGYNEIDLSFMPTDINALQWYDTDGEIERKDNRGQVAVNEKITDLTPYQPALDAWAVMKIEAAKAFEGVTTNG